MVENLSKLLKVFEKYGILSSNLSKKGMKNENDQKISTNWFYLAT